jgi:hypothetical protein
MVNNEVKQMVQQKNMYQNQIMKVYSYVQENQYEELNEDYQNVYHDKHKRFYNDHFHLNH